MVPSAYPRWCGWMMMTMSKDLEMCGAPPQQNSMTAFVVGEPGPVRGVEFKSYIDPADEIRAVHGKSRTTVRVTLNGASVYLSLDDFVDAALAVTPPWFLRKKLGA